MGSLQYLVSGTNEYGFANVERGSAAFALEKAKALLQQGYMDVRICTPTGRVLSCEELDELETDAKA